MSEVFVNNFSDWVALLTLLLSIILTFLGLQDDSKNKQQRLKFILSNYAITTLLVVYVDRHNEFLFGLFLLLILFFLLGGLFYSVNEEFELEKELKMMSFLGYSAWAWFFLTSNYILYFSIVVIYVAILMDMSLYILLIILGAAFVFQYLSVVKDYFDINYFHQTLNSLKEFNLNQSVNEKNIDDLFESSQLDLVAFFVYSEDKYFFDRKKSHITISNLIKSNFFSSLFARKKTREKLGKKFKKYYRGYSTIEQQIIRQYAMSENSYRYKLRRKIFFEWMYTSYFIKSMCNRKSKVYGRNKKDAKKKLIGNLKIMFVYHYFINILENPKDKSELIKNMSRQSSVKQEDYEYLFDIFIKGSKKENMKEKMRKSANNPYNFYDK